jgi:two-component system chemotaxis response regulator CheB
VLHIPPGYTQAFAKRLDESAALEVVEAAEGLELAAGRVIVARAGQHLKLTGQLGALRCHLDFQPTDTLHRPAVNVLFESAAHAAGARTLGVVLTGMGDDGLNGARAIRAAGGTVLTEAASSCVVYGMPRVIAEAGLSSGNAPIDKMAEAIIKFL